MFDSETLKEYDLHIAITESNEPYLLLTENTLLIAFFLKRWLPNNKHNMTVLLEIRSEVHNFITILACAELELLCSGATSCCKNLGIGEVELDIGYGILVHVVA